MRIRPAILVAALMLGACASTPDPTPNREPAPEAETHDVEQLEAAFWYCDYTATTKGVLAAPMAACSYATTELRNRKFAGSFRAMLAWWQENKAAEHGKLAAAAGRSETR